MYELLVFYVYFHFKKNITEYYQYTLRDLDSRYNKSMETALKSTKNVSPYDVKAFAPYKERFRAIEQSSIDDLDLLIVEKKAKLNCLIIDPNAPKVYCLHISLLILIHYF